ncbi:uncharacterized protein N7496_006448 [Penicillium cataractarum]|uniref:Uncharacterized protein n=1 Tax=Penicillium cataractarum TaxID=2100454 RepID=A0A9W9S1P9_9EURO|nr:uncharacterized protein N7496_006448 [Penicillium cataractarum]KAJ5370356.1 hypothetical protein N7496_006448 [Penicillium cataractarum]
MGNICSRSSNEPEAFAGPGRVVGAPPAGSSNAPRASVPAKANWKNSPGRTLGESSPQQGGSDEARSNAAIAAQKRAEAASASSKGKLGTKLAAQKAKTQTQTLNEVSQTERAVRDADGAEEARQWN